jgi:hypothetical protein
MERNKAIILLGAKFYNKADNEFKIYRVMNVDGDGICSCKVNNDKEYIKISADDLVSNYIKLIPDGVITFFVVSTMISKASNVTSTPKEEKWLDDVMITYRTSANIDSGTRVPDIIARQNAKDFQFNIITQENNHEFVGFCATMGDIPENLPIDMLLECDTIKTAVNINTYINDNESTIMEVLGRKSRRFDTVFASGITAYLESKHIMDIGQKSIKGHCRTLKKFLSENNFWYSLDEIYNIIPIKKSIDEITMKMPNKLGEEFISLTSEAINTFSNIFRVNISKTIVVRYDHDIDLEELPKDGYFLFRDSNGDLYVVRFVENGKFLESDLELEAYTKAMEEINLHNKYGRALERLKI